MTDKTPAQRVQAIFDEAVVVPCKKCGGVDFYKDGKCKPCKKTYALERYYSKLDENRVKSRDYARAHKNDRRDYAIKYRDANQTKILATEKLWRVRNAAHISLRNKTWRDANIAKARYNSVQYRISNPDAYRRYAHNRRVRQENNGGKLSKGLSERLYKLQRGRCACCGKPLGSNYHLDHIMPLSLGGANEDWNIQLLRATCNHQKHAKHPIAFMQERGKLL